MDANYLEIARSWQWVLSVTVVWNENLALKIVLVQILNIFRAFVLGVGLYTYFTSSKGTQRFTIIV